MVSGRHAWHLATLTSVLLLAVSCRGGSQETETQTTGERLYAINCSTCHGPSGKGLASYPKLIGVADILNGDYARTVVSQGRNLMPSFATTLTQEQINEIIDYVATFKN